MHQFLRPRPARWAHNHRGSPDMRLFPIASVVIVRLRGIVLGVREYVGNGRPSGRS